ncbi:MAG: LacI family DNA-binding transcriptional regulator, partial [Caldilineaceae bacterium]|nr:LacI family DNA-binding transcriptional regulator [Caldilineaceae bacterium]
MPVPMRPVTMRDVAREAGVSINSVLRVIHEQGNVDEATKARILAVIEELGYQPKIVTNGVVAPRTNTVGIIIADITNPYFSAVVRGAQDMARYHDSHIVLCNTNESQEEELYHLLSLAEQRVDGIIIFPGYYTSKNLSIIAERYRPIVVINHRFVHPNVSLVLTKNYEGARLAVNHLVAQGHSAIGMLAGRELSPKRGQRVRGFRDGLTAHGLSVIEEHIVPGAPTQESGYDNALELLTRFPEITALFAYNDLMALGALKACRELGRRVPEECAIVGFDDTLFASLTMPALTTIRLNKYATGREAMSRL